MVEFTSPDHLMDEIIDETRYSCEKRMSSTQAFINASYEKYITEYSDDMLEFKERFLDLIEPNHDFEIVDDIRKSVFEDHGGKKANIKRL